MQKRCHFLGFFCHSCFAWEESKWQCTQLGLKLLFFVKEMLGVSVILTWSLSINAILCHRRLSEWTLCILILRLLESKSSFVLMLWPASCAMLHCLFHCIKRLQWHSRKIKFMVSNPQFEITKYYLNIWIVFPDSHNLGSGSWNLSQHI